MFNLIICDMDKTAKIIISIIAVAAVLVVFVALAGVMSESGGHVPGIIGLILFGSLYYGLKAMWKKDKNNNKDESSLLQK